MTEAIDSLLSSLWRASWQGALALLSIWLLCHVFVRRLTADTHCWLWRLSYVKMLLGLLWGGAVLLPLLSPAPLPLVAKARVSLGPYQANVAGTTVVGTGSSVPITAGTQTRPRWAWRTGVAALYLLGVAACLGRLLLAARQARRALRSATSLATGPQAATLAALARSLGLRRPPPLALSDTVDGPILLGGSVLLPAEARYADSDLRMILAHELAHSRRRDLQWEWLGTLVQVVFFFHPLVVLARREERLAREAAADALALLTAEAVAADYGRMLLSLALDQGRPRPMLLGAMGVIEGGPLLRRRLLALRDASSRRTGRRIALILVALVSLVLVPWQMTHVRAQTPAPSSAPDTFIAPTLPVGYKQITGVVYDEKNAPVAGIDVALIWSWSQKQKTGRTRGGSSSVARVTTDTQGRFSFTNLPAGRFDYEVWSPTDQYVSIMSPLTLGNADIQKTLRVVASTGSVVTGRVVDGRTGKPMAGVYVGAGSIPPGGDLAKWDFWAMPSEGITDPQGHYQVRVTPGDVFVGVGRIENSTLTSRRVQNAVQRVSVRAGQTVSALDLSVFLRPVIVCVGPDGQPVVDTTFRITPEDMTHGAYITDDRTDATGTVVLGLGRSVDRGKSGSFSIIQGDLAASGTFHWSPNSPLVIMMDGQRSSYPDGVATVKLTMGSTSPVTGSVVSEDGTPITNALIRVVETDRKSHYGLDDHVFRTDASGAFRAPLEPSGEYHAYIRADGFNQVSVSEAPLIVVKGKTTSLGTIHLARAEGSVSGRVMDSSGKPMSGVLAYVQGGKTFLSAAVTDDQGHFRIPNVVVGEALRLELCRHGEARDSGTALSQSNEEMHIPGVKASPLGRVIVWHPNLGRN